MKQSELTRAHYFIQVSADIHRQDGLELLSDREKCVWALGVLPASLRNENKPGFVAKEQYLRLQICFGFTSYQLFQKFLLVLRGANLIKFVDGGFELAQSNHYKIVPILPVDELVGDAGSRAIAAGSYGVEVSESYLG